MKSTMNKLYLAIMSTLLATSLTACGSSSSEEGGEITVVDATLKEASTYKNNLFCNNPSTAVEDICNIRMYQIMVEAFNNGDNNINYDVGYGTSNHKGDIQGVIDQLDYIKGLGINAIWLTPVFQSADTSTPVTPLDATGYFGEDYYKIDPHFGSEDTFRTLVDAAHAKGMYVFLDGVFGHFKSTISRTSPSYISLVSTDVCQGLGSTYTAGEGTLCADHSQEATLDFYKELAAHYITEYKIDGWRLDQAYQVPVKNWKEIREAVEEAAKNTTYTRNGETVHPLGYMVGEIWSGDSQITQYGYGSDSLPGLKSNFAFNTRYGIVKALAVEESSAYNHKGTTIQNELVNAENTYPDFAVPNYFISNHDLVRFGDLLQRGVKKKALSSGNYDSDKYWKRYRLAHTVIASLSGPITIFYGDEWGQEVPNFDVQKNEMSYYDDHVARVTGQFSGFSSDQENLKNYVSEMLKIRNNSKALSMGTMTDIGTDSNLFAVKKTYGDSEVIVVMNIQEDKQINVTFENSLFSDESAAISLKYMDLSKASCSEEEVYPAGTTYSFTLEPLGAAVFFNKL